ncbi:lysozyme [Saccharopolyspora hattusasensis]|uniref:lysozyme n=1 Tax=Saccharopolyspora hattusasensis TaxID=1128679 RepID=UPI003D958ECA
MSTQVTEEPPSGTETNATMGSQIRKHEGGGDDPLLTPDVDPLATVAGMDVASYQRNVNWKSWWDQGMRFAYVKATEGTSYKNPYFAQQYNGSYNVGMIRGAYHFALPDRSSGAAQANYFVDNGGGWSKDGKTLPGALDMEYNPYGGTCYGKSKSGMTAWIKDFSDTYHSRTGRWPVIYTSTSWWNQCVGGDFSSTNPLWVARYASAVGQLPYNWGIWTIWQYTSSPLDKNTFNGAYDRLQALANG